MNDWQHFNYRYAWKNNEKRVTMYGKILGRIEQINRGLTSIPRGTFWDKKRKNLKELYGREGEKN
jgi:hypothetical protein